ncbi:MAG: hypothetical protein WCE75_10760 [Terracidiphilus sp.]
MKKRFVLRFVLLAASAALTGCAWMVNWMAAEPPAPVVHPMQGLRTIRVTAANRTASPRLAPAALEAGLVRTLNVYAQGVRFVPAGEAADGVLAVVVLEERGARTRTDPQADTEGWKFLIRYSASLTDADGRVIWQGARMTAKLEMDWTGYRRAGGVPGWTPEILNELTQMMGSGLAEDLAKVK